MTNEERDKAIGILQWLHDNDFLFRSTEEDVKYATKLAIQELEQEPCDKYIKEIDHLRKYIYKLETQIVEQESCEDAIRRQSVLEGLASIAKAKAKSDAQKAMMGRSMLFVERLPSVSTEKTGYWKKIKSGDKNFPESIVCSRCGYENSYINEWNFNNEPLSKVFKTSKCCPNCGCRMVEPQESEE